MGLNKEQMMILKGVGTRNALPWSKYYWPHATVVYIYGKGLSKCVAIQYKVIIIAKPNSKIAATAKRIIHRAMRKISLKTCVKYRHTANFSEPHVVIERTGDNCWSSIGYYTKSKMRMNLGKQCMVQAVVQHELLHVLGFLHMHNVPDRDKYVKIVYENIEETEKYNFKIFNEHTFNMTYDYNSIMHYGPYLFSVNGKKTIIPLKKDARIGEARGMSVKDVKKVNNIYCDGK